MKKQEVIYLVLMLITIGVSVFYLPWYMPLIIAAIITSILGPRKRVIALTSILTGAGWYFLSAFLADQVNESILSTRMSALFGDIGLSGLLILTAFIGFIMVLVGAMLGNSVYSLKSEL